ncbi:four-carbon acid sugar kinase family protein [bacterium]|nr:four-carbon acid sugar kinase family protein [bacterium]
MIINSNIVGIIADDLTGANDTALQFKLNGADTNILLNKNIQKAQTGIPQAWAISTESRNVSPQEAFEKVQDATYLFTKEISPDFYYKKIDSTIRGNIAVEVMSLLEVLSWDAAIIMPAFPQEGRITVGGYHLLKGIPIERTEMARDPHSPITESHLPTLIKQQLGTNLKDIVDVIDLKTILDGAGPILMHLNTLISQGKKIIIADSASTTDLEQIVLAMQKSNYQILPVGTAAAAKVLSNVWFPPSDEEEILPIKLPKLPKLVISGSATQITANQIDKLEQCEEFEENCLIIELNLNNILAGVDDNLVNRIVSNLGNDNIVLVHTSKLIKNFDGFADDTVNADLTKAGLASVITDFLAELTKRVLEKKKSILITLGGETSYKCCNAIDANQLKLIDEVLPAIALSRNVNSDQWIVTKSGNLGGVNTLIEILKYFNKHEE